MSRGCGIRLQLGKVQPLFADKVEEAAQARGVSVGTFIRRAVAKAVDEALGEKKP